MSPPLWELRRFYKDHGMRKNVRKAKIAEGTIEVGKDDAKEVYE